MIRRCLVLMAAAVLLCCSMPGAAQSDSIPGPSSRVPCVTTDAPPSTTATVGVTPLRPEQHEFAEMPQRSDHTSTREGKSKVENESRPEQRTAFGNAIQQMKWQDWAAIAGFLFGIVTLIAYIDQIRSNKSQAQMLEFVRRQLNRDISKEEIQALTAQRAQLEEQVRKHIPALARAAVLKEQSEAHASAIAHHYKEWHRLQSELSESPTSHAIDPVIEQMIVDRIVPKFEHQARVDAVRNRIVIYSVGLAVFNAIFFFPVDTLFSMILVLPLMRDVGLFLRLTGRTKGLLGLLFSPMGGGRAGEESNRSDTRA